MGTHFVLTYDVKTCNVFTPAQKLSEETVREDIALIAVFTEEPAVTGAKLAWPKCAGGRCYSHGSGGMKISTIHTRLFTAIHPNADGAAVPTGRVGLWIGQAQRF